MSVELWFAPTYRNPGGHRSTFNTLDEALAQARSDIESGREPAPVRVEDGGRVVADSTDFVTE